MLLLFRDLDRERTKMENQEKKVINDIKKMAKEGQMVNIFLLVIKGNKKLKGTFANFL